jgi:hypothetical protein
MALYSETRHFLFLEPRGPTERHLGKNNVQLWEKDQERVADRSEGNSISTDRTKLAGEFQADRSTKLVAFKLDHLR